MYKGSPAEGFVIGEGKNPPSCDFCEKEYESLGVQVDFGGAFYEICPSCLLKEPKVVAAETTRRLARDFNPSIRRWFMNVKGFANKLKTVERFEDLPNGILAVKIAEGYRAEMEHRRGKAA